MNVFFTGCGPTCPGDVFVGVITEGEGGPAVTGLGVMPAAGEGGARSAVLGMSNCDVVRPPGVPSACCAGRVSDSSVAATKVPLPSGPKGCGAERRTVAGAAMASTFNGGA